MSEEALKFYFENTRRSGGGDVKEIKVLPGKNAVQITFEEPEGIPFISFYDIFAALYMHIGRGQV